MKIPHRLDNILAPPPTRAGFERDTMVMNEAIKTMNKVMGEQHTALMDALTETDRRFRNAKPGPKHHLPATQREMYPMSLTNGDDDQYGAVYRCEDCGKVLEDDDLNFDDDGIRLCNLHYEYLLADTAAMSDEEYRQMYETPFTRSETQERQ